MNDEIRKFVKNTNWELITDYHFGGYAKNNEKLFSFMNSFYKQTNIPSDQVYTAKLFYALCDLTQKNLISNESFHVVKKQPNRKAVYLAGSGGRIGYLQLD